MSLNRIALFALLLCCAVTGCSLIENAAHTLVIDPIHYCTYSDRCISHRRHQQMAEVAWEQTVRAHPAEFFSADYGFGFREGFADYLYAGPGNVPALPPRRYWKARYQSPEGHQAILDWYDGFAHGARAAAASGYRQFVTLPSYFSPTFVAEVHSLPIVEPPDAEVIPTPLPTIDGFDEPGHEITPPDQTRRQDSPSPAAAEPVVRAVLPLRSARLVLRTTPDTK